MNCLLARSARGIGLLLLSLGGLAACGSQAPDDGVQASTAVRAAISTSGPARPPIETSGLLGGKDEMRLSFKTGGFLARVLVPEGAAVDRGQLLAELDLVEVRAQVTQALAAAEKADRDLERGERLHAEQVISLETLENLRTQATVARAARDAAQFNFGFSRIVAPRAGTVLRRFIEEREFVAPGQAVLALGSTERGQIVRAGVTDRDIVQIEVGDTATVRLDAYPDRKFAAKVSEKSAAADPRTGLFPLEIELETNATLPQLSGMIAKVTIVPSAGATGTLTYVPIGAIVEGRGERAFVFVVEGEFARKRSVGIAFIDQLQVALSDGLEAGAQVVTEGGFYLQDGERIRIVDDAVIRRED